MFKFASVMLAALLVIAFGVGKASFLIQGNAQQANRKEDTTPVQEYGLTEKQKQHSKLFKHGGPNLRSLAGRGTGDIKVSADAPYVISLPENAPPPLPFMQSTICSADAAVVGLVKNESPQFTEGESFLFTEYELIVEEVIKNNVAVPIQQGSRISVIRDGGVGKFNGRTIRAEVENFKPLAVDNRYLLCLRFIPATNSYVAYANGTFQLNDNEIVPLGKMPGNESRDAAAFLTAARATAGCKNQ